MRIVLAVVLICLSNFAVPADPPQAGTPVVADPALAKKLGADERGMRHYVLVILKSSRHRVPDGPERKAMFKGHFANIRRLAGEGKLIVAGPFEDKQKNGWRGMFVFAVDTIPEAKCLVATDPVIRHGEMVAEYHSLYASAALMAVSDIHRKIAPQ